MSRLPVHSLSRADDGRLHARFTLPANDDAFAGHFPGAPILPGVVQIDWALQVGYAQGLIAAPSAKDFRVKFRRPIRPDRPLSLAVWRDAEGGHLHFEFRDGDEVASLGRIRIG